MSRSFVLCALLAAASSAGAQVISNSESSTVSSSGSTANTSNAMTINSTTPENQRVTYAGDYNVRSAPGTVLGGFSGSFSSDYCSGTTQVGASGLGWSLGGGKQTPDRNCQKLRRVERFGQLAVSAGGDRTLLGRQLLSMATWEICTTDKDTTKACQQAGLIPKSEEAAQ